MNYYGLKYFCGGVEIQPPFLILLLGETVKFSTKKFFNGAYFMLIAPESGNWRECDNTLT